MTIKALKRKRNEDRILMREAPWFPHIYCIKAGSFPNAGILVI